jgi:hypothetical protein
MISDAEITLITKLPSKTTTKKTPLKQKIIFTWEICTVSENIQVYTYLMKKDIDINEHEIKSISIWSSGQNLPQIQVKIYLKFRSKSTSSSGQNLP